MTAEPAAPRSVFAKSPHHLALAFLTLGAGIASATPLGVLLGVGLYALGWIHVPDWRSYRAWLALRDASKVRDAEAVQVAEFVARRNRILADLTPARRDVYEGLAAVARDIERASRDNSLTPQDPGSDPRIRKLDELMWTYLRLLGIEQSLEYFISTERADDLPDALRDATRETESVEAEATKLQNTGGGPECESKKRLAASLRDRVDVLRKRLDRQRQAEENLKLVLAERERLVQQVKLIRADAVATRNADALSARIDATVEHLGETNKWLAEMDQFKDVVGDMPQTGMRVGFDTQPVPDGPPPPVAAPAEPEPAEDAAANLRRRIRRREMN